MSIIDEYGGVRPVDRTRTVFGQVMWYVAATAGLFALGAYLGRNLPYDVALVCYLLAFACLIGMRFSVRRSAGLSVALLFGLGLLVGLALSPTLVYYAGSDPQALWQAGAATALFVAGFGARTTEVLPTPAAGYATRRDLSALARVAFWALLALIVFGIVLIFVRIPGGALIYSVLGLVIFAGLTMVDFQRLRRSTDLSRSLDAVGTDGDRWWAGPGPAVGSEATMASVEPAWTEPTTARAAVRSLGNTLLLGNGFSGLWLQKYRMCFPARSGLGTAGPADRRKPGPCRWAIAEGTVR